ncbi:MAG: VPLPA-CTERM sorting domain-containing protein [Sulfuricaulis sp.]|nr:VPLPA-CTERM sorting domain-containing protein [Sulfuricaulis sp.]
MKHSLERKKIAIAFGVSSSISASRAAARYAVAIAILCAAVNLTPAHAFDTSASASVYNVDSVLGDGSDSQINGGSGISSASAYAATIPSPNIGCDARFVPFCPPPSTASASANLGSGTLRTRAFAYEPFASDPGIQSSTTMGIAGFSDTFYVTTPANSLGQTFNFGWQAAVTGNMNVNYGNTVFSLAYNFYPERFDLVYGPYYEPGTTVNTTWLTPDGTYVPTIRVFSPGTTPTGFPIKISSDTSNSTNWNFLEEIPLPGGASATTWTVFLTTEMRAGATVGDRNGSALSDFSSTLSSQIVYDPNLIVASESGVFPAMASVPVPAAVWLFGSGLLGLIGVARRKKA